MFRTDNAAWFYANPGGTNENSMKRTLHQGGPDALNLYSTTAGDSGWAFLPSIVTKPGQAHLFTPGQSQRMSDAWLFYRA